MNTDYIMRMIAQFVQAVASIIRSRQKGHYDEAFRQIQDASQRHLSGDIFSFLKRTPE